MKYSIVEFKGGVGFKIDFIISNDGKTPARNCSSWGGHFPFASKEDILFFPKDEGQGYGETINPGGTRVYGMPPLTAWDLQRAQRGELVWAYFNATYYDDPLAKERRQFFFGYRFEILKDPALWLKGPPRRIAGEEAAHYLRLKSVPVLSRST